MLSMIGRPQLQFVHPKVRPIRLDVSLMQFRLQLNPSRMIDFAVLKPCLSEALANFVRQSLYVHQRRVEGAKSSVKIRELRPAIV